MSISSLLTTEAPLSPTAPQAVPSTSSRHSNIQLTAMSDDGGKLCLDIPPPSMALPVLLKNVNEKEKSIWRYFGIYYV